MRKQQEPNLKDRKDLFGQQILRMDGGLLIIAARLIHLSISITETKQVLDLGDEDLVRLLKSRIVVSIGLNFGFVNPALR